MVAFGSASTRPPAEQATNFRQLLNHPPQHFYVKPLPFEKPFRFYKKLRPHFAHSFILESAPGPQRLAEFTFLGFDPQHCVRLDAQGLSLDGVLQTTDDPLAFLRGLLRPYALDAHPQLKYMGGLVGYFGYDFVPYLERRVPRPDAPHAFPNAELGLYLDGVVYDHKEEQAYYFSHAEDRSDAWLELAQAGEPDLARFCCEAFACQLDEARFKAAVLEVQRAIREGEIYQLVLSRQLQGAFEGDALQAYERMRGLTPSPYMYFVEFGKRSIAGSSPEMLVAVQDGVVTTYPIAGTRPLGQSEAERQRLAQDLLSDEKERAEHVMLVDLARNDVGRVARVGSVEVSEFMHVEAFSHVQHMVSCVQGRLQQGLDALDALGSVFPAGTVSGAPKVRAMELIHQLEPCARGPYAGVVGYLSLNGNLDTAIAIRTAFFDHDQVYLQAGAGIVADSVPESEFAETEHKLGPMREALSQGGAR